MTLNSVTRINKIAAITLLLFVFITSCKKNQLGGKSKVSGYVVHHYKNIAYASIFIKFDAVEFPGTDTTKYDTKVSADGSGFYSINNFHKGDYYLYAVGKDYGIDAPYIVEGGISVTLRRNEEVERTIAVTEGD